MKYITKYSMSIKDIIILVALDKHYFEPKSTMKHLNTSNISHAIYRIKSILPGGFFESRDDLQYQGQRRAITNTAEKNTAIIAKAVEVKQKYIELCELIKNEHQLNEGLK